MTQISIHAFMQGKVQGVSFRASTVRCAQQNNLTGWVRNLPDGRVELFASGEKENIANLVAWLQQGPPGAIVDSVQIEEKAFENHAEFIIVR